MRRKPSAAGDNVNLEPNWIKPAECIVMHELILARYGGLPGVRDEAVLAAALAMPKELFAAGCRSLAKLATGYVRGISQKQPFQSGNLAIAFLVAITFLRVHGRVFTGKEVVAANETSDLAAGKCPEEFYRRWLLANSCN